MIDAYLGEMAAFRASSTVRLRRYQLRSFEARCGDVLSATRSDVVGWLAGEFSASTRASKRAALEGFYDWLQAEGHTAGSPLAGLPRVKIPASEKRDIPDAAVAQVLAGCDVQVADAIVLGRWAGLRAAEIAAVHKVDWSPGVLAVRGKGSRRRNVPVGAKVDEMLACHEGFVFPGRFGGHVQAGTVTDWLRRALPAPFTAHSLRHAFATDFYAASGYDLLATARVLGHSSVETTRRYVHRDRDWAPIVARIGQGIA
jgi:integrase